ncbi:hypothetical protein N7501_011467 [Penicillium viridicatum]|nr:hypothetical protein N7501_011467 [Penicillium viridicatum]
MKFLSGTEERDAINSAYGYSQKYGCIAATAILVLAVPPSRDLGLFRNPKRCDNIGDAEPNHVNSRTDDLNSFHFCLSEGINDTKYPVLKSDRLFGA